MLLLPLTIFSPAVVSVKPTFLISFAALASVPYNCCYAHFSQQVHVGGLAAGFLEVCVCNAATAVLNWYYPATAMGDAVLCCCSGAVVT